MNLAGSRDDTLVVYYDFKRAPVTFDFIHYIIAAHSYAVLNKLGRFDVVLIADAWRNASAREQGYSLAERRWRLWNLIMEVLRAIPNVRNISVVSEPLSTVAINSYPPSFHPEINKKIFYDAARVIKFNSMGVNVQVLRASDYATSVVERFLPRTSQKVVTITLRKAAFESVRDSRLEDWYKFYKELEKRGYKVVVIPDQDDSLTERTITKDYDWDVFVPACMSVDLRLALYERADMNYVTNGGIIGLFLYGTFPFLWYSVTVEGSPTSTEKYYQKIGLEVGGKYPWLKDNQEMIWEPDSFENLMESLPLLDSLPVPEPSPAVEEIAAP